MTYFLMQTEQKMAQGTLPKPAKERNKRCETVSSCAATQIFAVLYSSKPGPRIGSPDPARHLGWGLSCLTSDD